MTFDEFSTLVRTLHERLHAEKAFLDSLPSQVSEFVATNDLSELLYDQRELLCAAAFGERWPDVSWFLFDWLPGFAITVGVDSQTPKDYVIHSVDDYLAYAKNELFSGEKES